MNADWWIVRILRTVADTHIPYVSSMGLRPAPLLCRLEGFSHGQLCGGRVGTHVEGFESLQKTSMAHSPTLQSTASGWRYVWPHFFAPQPCRFWQDDSINMFCDLTWVYLWLVRWLGLDVGISKGVLIHSFPYLVPNRGIILALCGISSFFVTGFFATFLFTNFLHAFPSHNRILVEWNVSRRGNYQLSGKKASNTWSDNGQLSVLWSLPWPSPSPQKSTIRVRNHLFTWQYQCG